MAHLSVFLFFLAFIHHCLIPVYPYLPACGRPLPLSDNTTSSPASLYLAPETLLSFSSQ